MYQQYLAHGPTSPARHLRTVVPGSGGQRGVHPRREARAARPALPPVRADRTAGRDVDVRVVRGAGPVRPDADPAGRQPGVRVRPGRVVADRHVTLAKVTGEVSASGKVVLDMAAGAYTRRSPGSRPGPPWPRRSATAVTASTRTTRPSTRSLGRRRRRGVAGPHPDRVRTSAPSRTRMTPNGGCVLLLVRTKRPRRDGRARLPRTRSQPRKRPPCTCPTGPCSRGCSRRPDGRVCGDGDDVLRQQTGGLVETVGSGGSVNVGQGHGPAGPGGERDVLGGRLLRTTTTTRRTCTCPPAGSPSPSPTGVMSVSWVHQLESGLHLPVHPTAAAAEPAPAAVPDPRPRPG